MEVLATMVDSMIIHLTDMDRLVEVVHQAAGLAVRQEVGLAALQAEVGMAPPAADSDKISSEAMTAREVSTTETQNDRDTRSSLFLKFTFSFYRPNHFALWYVWWAFSFFFAFAMICKYYRTRIQPPSSQASINMVTVTVCFVQNPIYCNIL